MFNLQGDSFDKAMHEAIRNSLKEVINQDLALGEMHIEFSKNAYVKATVEIAIQFDVNTTQDISKIFSVANPTKKVELVGKLYIEGFQV